MIVFNNINTGNVVMQFSGSINAAREGDQSKVDIIPTINVEHERNIKE